MTCLQSIGTNWWQSTGVGSSTRQGRVAFLGWHLGPVTEYQEMAWVQWLSAFHAQLFRCIIPIGYGNASKKLCIGSKGKYIYKQPERAHNLSLRGSAEKEAAQDFSQCCFQGQMHFENGKESPWEMSRFSGKKSRSHTLTPHQRSLSQLTNGRSGNTATL